MAVIHSKVRIHPFLALHLYKRTYDQHNSMIYNNCALFLTLLRSETHYIAATLNGMIQHAAHPVDGDHRGQREALFNTKGFLSFSCRLAFIQLTIKCRRDCNDNEADINEMVTIMITIKTMMVMSERQQKCYPVLAITYTVVTK